MKSEPAQGDSPESKFVQLYAEIRRQAHLIVKNEAPDCSVEATALVHEAYEHVVHGNRERHLFQDPEHMLNALTKKMRLILVDRARRRGAAKRGGGRQREQIDFNQMEIGLMEASPLLALSEALEGLKACAPDSAQLVDWHIFLGMTISEVALKMDISRSKADSLWLHARHWLQRKMSES